MKYFYRMLAAFNSAVLVSAGIHLHLISENLGVGFLVGSLAFIACLFIADRGLAGFIFYILLLALALAMHSLTAAVGFFFSPFVAGGMHHLILIVAHHDQNAATQGRVDLAAAKEKQSCP